MFNNRFIDAQQNKEFMKRFGKLDEADQRKILQKIYKNQQSAENSNEVLENILGKQCDTSIFLILSIKI